MVTLNQLKNKDNQNFKPIQEGDDIPPEVCDYLATLGPKAIRELIETGEKKLSSVRLNVEYYCPKCQRRTVKRTVHGTFLKNLRGIRTAPTEFDLCDECRRALRAEAARPAHAYRIIGDVSYDVIPDAENDGPEGDVQAPAFPEATAEQAGMVNIADYPPAEYFLRTFLDPNKRIPSFGNDDPEQIAERVSAWATAVEADSPGLIKSHIRKMDYSKEFLRTPYWKIVAERTKYRAGYRCSLCASDRNLAAHHRNYDHQGEELFYPQDLVCVCTPCHQKHHTK